MFLSIKCPTLSELHLPPPGKTGWPWTVSTPQVPDTMVDGSAWPRVSIVTPSYNQGKFLEETIRSVLLQGYPNLEYIIIDGESTDGSVEIITKYEPWLTYWVSETDRGQSHAINKGFERATGEIFGWINSDDGYLPDTLFAVVENIKENMNMVIGAAVERDLLSGKTQEIRKCRTADEVIYLRKTIIQPSTFWTADLWNKSGPLDEDYKFALDYELWLRMFRFAESITYLDYPTSYINIHMSQKTNYRNSERIALEPFLAVMKNISLWDISHWKLFYGRHVRAKWKVRGLNRYIPRRADLPILIYLFSKKLGIYFAKKWCERS